jgi:hypothetical protein
LGEAVQREIEVPLTLPGVNFSRLSTLGAISRVGEPGVWMAICPALVQTVVITAAFLLLKIVITLSKRKEKKDKKHVGGHVEGEQARSFQSGLFRLTCQHLTQKGGRYEIEGLHRFHC